MSGPFGSSQWMYQSAAGFYPYQIEQSLRFNDNDSAYLSRTPASAGNQKTWTWSGWVKRGVIGTQAGLFMPFTGGDGSNESVFRFETNDKLRIYDSGGLRGLLDTVMVFRDPSAWYHIVAVLDTTQATSTNRLQIYVNGVLAALTGDYPTQNTTWGWNNTSNHFIGAYRGSTAFLDGYLAEVNFIDGTALDPTSFGEFKSGIWVPKAYSGSYGTNGFYLSFADSAAIGDDLSGNGNDWTANNLVSTDVLLDSPTENYAVLNPLDKNASLALSDGNLAFQASTTAVQGVRSTFAIPSGVKIYAECSFPTWTTGSANYAQFGIYTSTASTSGDIGNSSGTGFSIEANQLTDTQLRLNGTSIAVTGAVASNDVFQIAVDLDSLKVWLGKNNTWYNSSGGTTGDPATGANPTGTLSAGVLYFPAAAKYGTANSQICNFGQSAFAYTPPAGFLALNTANLPDPVIDPAQDDVPADYFNTVLWTGTGATQSITGVGFQPDWTWIKQRNAAQDHVLHDAVRGAGKYLISNSTAAEATNTNQLSSFDSDGFTVGTAISTNQSSSTYVAWNWKANGAGASNTDGSITSTVSVNQKAGFSIVGYTGTGAAATFGHGLGAAPSMVIVKNRTDESDWLVYHKDSKASGFDAEDSFISLNGTGGVTDSTTPWNNTAPTSSVFSLGTSNSTNGSSDNMIAYCFAEVEGYSKFGSYTGNGSTDGPFVYCGFRPAWVMVKRSSSGGGTANWVILDTKRDVYNLGGISLMPNLSNAEYTPASSGYPMDILSNGFKQRGASVSQNESGSTYIFMAFSEAPFKYSNAR